MAKALGSEIIAFYQAPQGPGPDCWPEGYAIDEEAAEQVIEDNVTGKLLIEPAQRYDLKVFGFLYDDEGGSGRTLSFATAFQKWQKARSTVVVSVSIAREKEEELRDLLIKAGYKPE